MSVSFLYFAKILKSAQPKGTQRARMWFGVSAIEKRPRPMTGRRCKEGVRGNRVLTNKMASCTSGPAASPNVFDYFTLQDTLQHIRNSESASSSAQKENKKERGDEIL